MKTWHMHAIPPDAEPGDLSVDELPSSLLPSSSAAARMRANKRRLIVLGVVLVFLVGPAAYFKLNAVLDAAKSRTARAALAADGIAVIETNAEPEDSPSPFDAWTPATIVRIQSSTNRITNAEMTRIAAISQNLNLVLGGCPITDDGLSTLAGKANVRCLDLAKTAVTDAGIKNLRGMNLQSLDLSATGITDAGLAKLGEFDFPNLKEIVLERTGVTDVGLLHLANFKALEWVSINGTKVTRNGIRHLQAKLPQATVFP